MNGGAPRLVAVTEAPKPQSALRNIQKQWQEQRASQQAQRERESHQMSSMTGEEIQASQGLQPPHPSLQMTRLGISQKEQWIFLNLLKHKIGFLMRNDA